MAPVSERFGVSRWLYLRGLGLIYIAAFVSFGVQLDGLIGADGILPAAPYLEQVVAAGYGFDRVPTLALWGASDAALHALWIAGAAAGLAVTLGLAPVWSLSASWVLYLSLVTAGRAFMAYQWDNLLLEAGFLAIWLAPLRWSPRAPLDAPSKIVVRLHHWLLFRLIFSSGFAKFAGSDPTWANLRALTHHFETQPLPTWLGWYWHQMPEWWQVLSCVGVIIGQLFIPVLIFTPGPVRRFSAICIAAFQVVIALTGNYGFFNFLTILLCVLLVDDAWWRRRLVRLSRWLGETRSRYDLVAALWRVPTAVVAVGIIVTSSLVFARTLGVSSLDGGASQSVLRTIYPYRSVNAYGLFASMTTQRPEIFFEGSDDGSEWKPYVLPYQAQALDQPPSFVAPHMPRLDWGMWFAALGSPRQFPWFASVAQRLLQGESAVLDLFAHNPFPLKPPRFVRAIWYDYRFTSLAQRRASGRWWRRSPRGLYLGPQTLP